MAIKTARVCDGVFMSVLFKTVQLCGCTLLSGGNLRIDLRAESKFIGCLSTIIVFMFSTTTNPAASSAGFPDRLSSGDAVSGSKSSTVARGSSHETTSTTTGQVAHVIRRVKVYFEDPQMAELRPTAPFKRPPRVSGNLATIQIEGLPPEK